MTNDSTSRTDAPVWFITGCSTGFGRELAVAALDRGKRVVVTARNPDAVRDIVTGHEEQALVLALDVNNRTAELGVELILSALGKRIL